MHFFNGYIKVFDLVYSISKAADLVSKKLGGHQLRVAYAASQVGRAFGMNAEQRQDIVLAGLLHDVGGISARERIKLLGFETGNQDKVDQHCEIGYQLLKNFEPLKTPADIIRFHHVPWKNGEGEQHRGMEVPLASHVIHLVDRAVVLLDDSRPVVQQSSEIIRKIKEGRKQRFNPQVVQAFEDVASNEAFWLDLFSDELGEIIRKDTRSKTLDMDMSNLLDFTRILSSMIDFRSRFTAAHSAGVASTARALSLMCGFTQREARMMTVAGHLHDLGKLAVPVEIIEKPGKLTTDEMALVRSHTYYSYRLLGQIPSLQTVNEWASLHHERLDGKGYPFGLDETELTLGARLMAVADVFTAAIEERPYRSAMSLNQAVILLDTMVMEQALDSDIVEKLKENKEEIYSACIAAQGSAIRAFETFVKSIPENMVERNGRVPGPSSAVSDKLISIVS
ncbi:MAG: HD domain-containing protein [Deltaproteobacteria bacterium]|nr:HD domain-containing protein [Deltaproteobacteria bacterium]